MKHIIIGTAGHIDHGKTTLIRALTGRNTDRLKEEQDRGITIELGFTWFDLESGLRCGIIDVPGHEKFIQQMVSGVVGMDMVLLVVAADEGIMPQTREHLDILELLGIEKCILVLTKCDTVDPEWVDMMEEDIRKELKDTILENAPVVRVSSVTGEGIEALKKEIEKMVSSLPERDTKGIPRLPIDRVFSLQGFGTIITGTLISGTLHKGDALAIYPEGLKARIRNIQVHEQDAEFAEAGQRVALNLSGVKKEELHKGSVISLENSMENSTLMDGKVTMLRDSKRSLKNRERLHFLSGTKEVLCRAVLLDKEEIAPGEEGLCEFILEEEMVFKRGDRFILRFYSPVETIGGGIVLEPNARKKKRFSDEAIQELLSKEDGSLSDVLETVIQEELNSLYTVQTLAKRLSHSVEEITPALSTLVEEGRVYPVDLQKERYFLHRENAYILSTEIGHLLEAFYKKHPYRLGMPKAEVREKVLKSSKQNLFDACLPYFNGISLSGEYLLLTDRGEFKDETYRKIEKNILQDLEAAAFMLPRVEELDRHKTKEEDFLDILQNLVVEEKVVKVGEDPELLILKENLEKGIAFLRSYFKENEVLGISLLKEQFESSRKCAKAMIQYFDKVKYTKKVAGESERVAGTELYKEV
ncbi:MAG: selenocysteine-specific translation elongation factor [Lachnospiraceae bacterium]|nr:selenocysteine-specific translation elongation factor [Lachnospiraceae bacterium]